MISTYVPKNKPAGYIDWLYKVVNREAEEFYEGYDHPLLPDTVTKKNNVKFTLASAYNFSKHIIKSNLP